MQESRSAISDDRDKRSRIDKKSSICGAMNVRIFFHIGMERDCEIAEAQGGLRNDKLSSESGRDGIRVLHTLLCVVAIREQLCFISGTPSVNNGGGLIITGCPWGRDKGGHANRHVWNGDTSRLRGGQGNTNKGPEYLEKSDGCLERLIIDSALHGELDRKSVV